jgi:hypothetical protein
VVRPRGERKGSTDPEGSVMLAVRLVNGQEYVRLRDLFRSLLPDSLPECWGATEMPGLIKRQEAVRLLIEGEFLAERISLFVILSDKDVMPLPDETRKVGEADGACFDSIDWVSTITQGSIYLRGLTVPVNLQHVMRPGDRPLLWVLAKEAKATLRSAERLLNATENRCPRTDPEIEGMIRVANGGNIPGKRKAWEAVRGNGSDLRQKDVFRVVEAIIERDQLDRKGGRPPKQKPS